MQIALNYATFSLLPQCTVCCIVVHSTPVCHLQPIAMNSLAALPVPCIGSQHLCNHLPTQWYPTQSCSICIEHHPIEECSSVTLTDVGSVKQLHDYEQLSLWNQALQLQSHSGTWRLGQVMHFAALLHTLGNAADSGNAANTKYKQAGCQQRMCCITCSLHSPHQKRRGKLQLVLSAWLELPLPRLDLQPHAMNQQPHALQLLLMLH